MPPRTFPGLLLKGFLVSPKDKGDLVSIGLSAVVGTVGGGVLSMILGTAFGRAGPGDLALGVLAGLALSKTINGVSQILEGPVRYS